MAGEVGFLGGGNLEVGERTLSSLCQNARGAGASLHSWLALAKGGFPGDGRVIFADHCVVVADKPRTAKIRKISSVQLQMLSERPTGWFSLGKPAWLA